ncbi:hypothetical protein [Pseudomonas aeruginosa]|uniref:hypothetical protein n=1 Tax=Pseudomonas aeruginosa TaxID=287 RepID=UPI000D46E87F|nr:hypothetical protein [Pseudomonas aeruginosa]PRW27460.1 hypothetical protein CSB96_6736 [Pseudomonas aeruginosa]
MIRQLGSKLPAEAQVIATGLPKDVAERMASVAPLKEGDLKKAMEDGQLKEIQQAVQSEMSDLPQPLWGSLEASTPLTPCTRLRLRLHQHTFCKARNRPRRRSALSLDGW